MRKTLLPHKINGEFKILEVITPEDYDEGQVCILSTVFDKKTKKGETIVVVQKQKGFYELEHIKKRISGYRSIEETKKSHKELVRKYGRSVHTK